MNKIIDTFWQRWPYLVTGLLGIISALALYKGVGLYVLLALIGIPALIFLMKSPSAVIVTQITYCVVIRFFIDTLGMPDMLIYFSDILNALLLLHIIMNFPVMGYKLRVLTIPGIFLLLITVVNIVSVLYNRVDLINIIWGMRIYYRFPLFLVGCIMFLNQEIFDVIWKIMLGVVCAQILLTTYQCFILQLHVDLIGGTFGMNGTGLLVQFFAMMLLIAYLRYLEGKCSIATIYFVAIAGLYVSLLNEGKAIIVFDITILIVILFQNGITLKKIGWLSLIAIITYGAYYLLGIIYPAFKDFLSMDALNQYVFSDSYGGIAINRLNGPAYFSKYFDNMQDLFGIGLGNAAASQYPVLQGDYYQRFYSTGYNWFYIAYVYIESGYLGLYLNIGFYLSFLLTAYTMRNRIPHHYIGFLIGIVLSCIMAICYNSSLIINEYVSYMYFLLLGLPLIVAVNEPNGYNYYPPRSANPHASAAR